MFRGGVGYLCCWYQSMSGDHCCRAFQSGQSWESAELVYYRSYHCMVKLFSISTVHWVLVFSWTRLEQSAHGEENPKWNSQCLTPSLQLSLDSKGGTFQNSLTSRLKQMTSMMGYGWRYGGHTCWDFQNGRHPCGSICIFFPAVPAGPAGKKIQMEPPGCRPFDGSRAEGFPRGPLWAERRAKVTWFQLFSQPTELVAVRGCRPFDGSRAEGFWIWTQRTTASSLFKSFEKAASRGSLSSGSGGTAFEAMPVPDASPDQEAHGTKSPTFGMKLESSSMPKVGLYWRAAPLIKRFNNAPREGVGGWPWGTGCEQSWRGVWSKWRSSNHTANHASQVRGLRSAEPQAFSRVRWFDCDWGNKFATARFGMEGGKERHARVQRVLPM